ncbi:MAG: PQQ-dependent sugar dehydrogenase [Pirellulales bacterium]
MALYLLLALHGTTCWGQSQPPSRGPTKTEMLTYCLREEGNIEHGSQLFRSEQLGCSQCHSVDGSRSRLGPAPEGEGRLSCLAFHPQFATNRKYYLYDRQTAGGRAEVVIEERQASADGRRDSGSPPRDILRVPQSTLVHFGGWLDFGSDGYLYITLGDSGPQEDPLGNAQNSSLLLGKILRLDVDRTEPDKPYAIPADNPYAQGGPCLPEVWASGFRAPWRCSFDPSTGDLWVGDVGQDRYEEVDLVRRGDNFGWNVYEGFAPFSNNFRRTGQTYVPPVFAYARRYGPSVTGGYVYRGQRSPTLVNQYVCGDYESKRIFAISARDRRLESCREIGQAPQRIVSFAIDQAGELYVVGYEGMIYRIDPSQLKM